MLDNDYIVDCSKHVCDNDEVNTDSRDVIYSTYLSTQLTKW